MSKSLEHNRSLQMMMSIEKVVRWRDLEALLMEHYATGTSKEGADAYPALMLLKALLLQKWFRIPSDPELENQINDRISFKKFLGLPLDRSRTRSLRRAVSLPGRRGASRPEADHSTCRTTGPLGHRRFHDEPI